MNYATGHALNTNELFLNFPNKKLKLSRKKCEKLIGNDHKEFIAKQVFKACVKMVIDDMIDNNATFQLPTRAKKAELYMKRYDGDSFVKCRQNGKFKDIKFLNSNFTAYQLAFKYQNAGVIKEKPIYLDPKNKQKITDNTNNGKSYY